MRKRTDTIDMKDGKGNHIRSFIKSALLQTSNEQSYIAQDVIL